MDKRIPVSAFFKKLWKNFPSALCICPLLFFIAIAAINSVTLIPLFENALPALILGLLFGAAGSLAARYFTPGGWLHWVPALVGCLIGYLMQESVNVSLYLGLVLMAVFIFLHLAVSCPHREIRFGQIAGCFLSSAGIAYCLSLLLILCSFAAKTLIFANSVNGFSLLPSISMFLPTTIVAPFLFLGRLPDENTPADKRNAFRKVTAYLLLPVFLLLTGILLIYIATIAAKWEMPVGEMNPYALAALAFFTLLRLTLTGEENRLSRLFCRFGAVPMVPVITAQQVGVWIRIGAYGLTPARYLSLALTLLLIAVVVLSHFVKPGRWFFAAAAVMAFLLFLSPLNTENVPRWNQENRLKAALSQSEMLDENGKIVPNPYADTEQQKRILSAAEYLLFSTDDVPENSFTARLKEQFVSDDDITLSDRDVFGFGTSDLYIANEFTFHGSCTSKSVDVAGFSHAQWEELYFDSNGCQKENPPFDMQDAVACLDWTGEHLLITDISLADGRVFRISYMQLLKNDNVAVNLYINGWLLTP